MLLGSFHSIMKLFTNYLVCIDLLLGKIHRPSVCTLHFKNFGLQVSWPNSKDCVYLSEHCYVALLIHNFIGTHLNDMISRQNNKLSHAQQAKVLVTTHCWSALQSDVLWCLRHPLRFWFQSTWRDTRGSGTWICSRSYKVITTHPIRWVWS